MYATVLLVPLSVLSSEAIQLLLWSSMLWAFELRPRHDRRWDFLMLSCSVFKFLYLENETNIPTVLQRSSSCQWLRLFSVRSQRFKHQPIVFCVVKATHNSFALALGVVSLFSSRAAATRFVRALASLNLKKKRDFSQSKLSLIYNIIWLLLFYYLPLANWRIINLMEPNKWRVER